MKKCTVLMLLVSFCIMGCASQKAWVYSPNYNFSNQAPVIEKSAVILPYEDARTNTNKNYVLMYLIPLMPCGWQNLSVPEGQAMHIFSGLWTNYKPSEDYPKALAQELNNARLFKEAYFDFKKGNSDFIIKGKILTTQYSGKMITYGLSVYGPLLWFVGFPAGTVKNELSVELSVLEAQSNDVIFSKKYAAPQYSRLGWLYVMPNGFNYPKMLKDIYKQFVEDMKINLCEMNAKLQKN